ncbi:MAG: hypothetical protein IKM07_04975, partial [Clostridia bacterium]|nr:hypothetical protein [Clostridia bacterium]
GIEFSGGNRIRLRELIGKADFWVHSHDILSPFQAILRSEAFLPVHKCKTFGFKVSIPYKSAPHKTEFCAQWSQGLKSGENRLVLTDLQTFLSHSLLEGMR